jgi:hypothetical protein
MMNEATSKNVRHPGASSSRNESWPEGVYTVSIDGLDHLGVDKEGLIYWDGRLIKMARKITLDTQERILAWIVAGATVVAAVATVVQAITAVLALP